MKCLGDKDSWTYLPWQPKSKGMPSYKFFFESDFQLSFLHFSIMIVISFASLIQACESKTTMPKAPKKAPAKPSEKT